MAPSAEGARRVKMIEQTGSGRLTEIRATEKTKQPENQMQVAQTQINQDRRLKMTDAPTEVRLQG